MFTLIPIVGIVIGIALIVWAVRAWRRGEATRAWPSLPGEITGVQVQQTIDSSGDVDYKACVTYRYSFGGRTFDGSRLAVGGSPTSQSQDAPLSTIKRYRLGMKVNVFHDPADPAYGVLEVGAQYPVIGLLLFFALTFIGISLVLLAGPR